MKTLIFVDFAQSEDQSHEGLTSHVNDHCAVHSCVIGPHAEIYTSVLKGKV